jgi:hypothetical protein
MRNILLIFVVLALLPLAARADQSYLSYVPDVPLMPGMAELEDQSFVFDKAEGRVTETAVFTSVSTEKEVKEYYRKVLPELGWASLSPDRFLRNGEQLVVKCDKVSGGVVVRFLLSPKQG